MMVPVEEPRLPRDLAPADIPGALLPNQQRLFTTVSQYAVTIGEKSRRIGWSWAMAAKAAETAASAKSAGGMNVYYIGYNLEMAREFVDYVGMWAEGFGLAAGAVEEIVLKDKDKDVKAFRVQFASGFEVVALPSTPRSLRGKQGLVIIDEAAFHDDLAELLKAAFALLIWGGRVVIISTHNGAENAFNGLVEDVRAGRKPYHLLRATFDEALAEGLYRRICLVRGAEWTAEGETKWRSEIRAFYGDAVEEELDVIPRRSGGSYLPAVLVERRMVEAPVLRLELADDFAQWQEHLRVAEIREWCEEHLKPLLFALDPDREHVFGQDFARSADLSVIWPLEIGLDLVRRTPFMVELRNIPHEAQRQILFFIVDRLPRFRGGKMDAGGNGSYLAEVTWQKYGACIDRLLLSVEWYRENFPPYKAAIEDGTVELPRDADVLADHRAVKIVDGVPRVPRERAEGTDGKKRHGDAAIAAALAYAASRADPMEFGYQAANANTDQSNQREPDEPRGARRFGPGAY